VDIGDSRVESESASGREPMRCVAGQEYSAHPVAGGDLGMHRPRLDRLDVYVDIGVTDGVVDMVAADRGREVARRLEWREIRNLKYQVLWCRVDDEKRRRPLAV
jgi:cation transport regulator ChaC